MIFSRMVRRNLCLYAFLAACILYSSSSRAAAGDHIVSMAMGNTGVALPAGVEAVGMNPALLALPRSSSIEIPFLAFGLQADNNSFGLEDYNRYSGAMLTDRDKSDILSRIPEDGFGLRGELGVMGPSFAAGNLALTLRGIVVSDLFLDRKIFETLLYGNAVVRDLNIEETNGEAWAVSQIGVSYAKGIPMGEGRLLSLGFTGSYLRGWAAFRSRELRGRVITDILGLQGGGYLAIDEAFGGEGIGLDVGAAFLLGNSWVFGVSILNVLGSIHWTEDVKTRIFEARLDTINVENADEFEVEERTTERGSFHTRIPPVLLAGFSKRLDRLTLAAETEMEIHKGVGGTKTKRLAAGLEYRLLSWFRLRSGVSYRPEPGEGTSISGGLGFYLWVLHFDLAVLSTGSLSPNDTHGIAVGVRTGLFF